jgi:glucokinase
MYVLAADVGGSKIAVARVSHTGRISERREVPTPPEGGDAVVSALAELLAGLSRDRAAAVAVDIPGLAYRDGSVWAPNIHDWDRLPLAKLLRQRLRLPVLVESDRNAFVMGEAWRGAAQDAEDAIFLIIGTGLGAGILSGGRLIRGYAELAGAVGWMAIRDDHQPVYEKVGCAEAHVAGPGIGAAATNVFDRALTTPDVARMARRGDTRARQIFERAGHHLGLVIANLVSTFNPEIIVVGGGVASAADLLLPTAEETMLKWAQPLASRQVRIVRSALGRDAGLLGVARLALARLAPSD